MTLSLTLFVAAQTEPIRNQPYLRSTALWRLVLYDGDGLGTYEVARRCNHARETSAAPMRRGFALAFVKRFPHNVIKVYRVDRGDLSAAVENERVRHNRMDRVHPEAVDLTCEIDPYSKIEIWAGLV